MSHQVLLTTRHLWPKGSPSHSTQTPTWLNAWNPEKVGISQGGRTGRGKERGRQWEEYTRAGRKLCVPTQTSAGGRTPAGPLKLRISLGLRRIVRPFDMCWDMKHRKITSKVHSQNVPYRHGNAPEDLHGGWTHKSPASFIEQSSSHSHHTAPPKAPPTVTSSLQICLSRTIEPLLYHHL